MSVTTNTYKIGKLKQLIDLNGDNTNFNVSFKVTSENGEDFNALVVDQKTLDSGDELNYKLANGILSGSINADKNVYQNYFLILKAETPTNVTVEINIEELPQKMNTEQMQQPRQVQQVQQVQQIEPPMEEYFKDRKNNASAVPKKKDNNGMKNMLIFAALLGAVVFLWYCYSKKQLKQNI